MTKTTAEMWDARYGEPGFAFGTEPNDFLTYVVDWLVGWLPTGGRVLCLAEGEGRNAVFLAGRGFVVTAVDASAVGLEKAQTLAAERGVQVQAVVADLADFDIGHEEWDAVVSIFCHLPPALRADVYGRVVDGLRPGGVFVLESYTPAQVGRGTGGPSDPELMPTADALCRDLAGMDFRVLREVERDVREGRLHNGLSSVVQVLATKA